MADILKPDFCVVGAGGGGTALALAAAGAGARTVLVATGQDPAEPGLADALAPIAHAAHGLTRDGMAPKLPGVEFSSLMEAARASAAWSATSGSLARLTAQGVHVIRDGGHFIDRRSFHTAQWTIRPRHFVVAGSARPVIPAIPGMEAVAPLTLDHLGSMTGRPAHLALIGDDPKAAAIAQAFARAGCRVTLFAAGPLIPDCDPELAGFALRQLRLDGVTIRQNADLVRIEHGPKGGVRLIEIDAGQEIATDATQILVASGGQPDLAMLQPDKAGIRLDAKGCIRVSDRLVSSNRLVHAIGPANGTSDPIAIDRQVDIVAGALLHGRKARFEPAFLPRVVRTGPEIAWVGLTETAAVRSGKAIRIHRLPYAEISRGAHGGEAGLVKLVTDAAGTLLGAGIAGAAAGEQIALWSLVLTNALKPGDIAELAGTSGNFSEASRQAARLVRQARPRASLWDRLRG
jgi:pyruvate/2-oxoglutarate dehydrogenase complex dihydrolipoamide dehydrogenase (E3) component